jgi:MFS family permease
MTDVIGSNNFLAYFHTIDTSPIIGAINSTYNGGAVFGSLMGGLTMDRYGRKMTIQMGALICLVGATLQAAARNLSMMLVGRIFAGWAVGLLSMSVPVCAYINLDHLGGGPATCERERLTKCARRSV